MGAEVEIREVAELSVSDGRQSRAIPNQKKKIQLTTGNFLPPMCKLSALGLVIMAWSWVV